MTEITKETISTEASVASPQTSNRTGVVTPSKVSASGSQTVEYLIYFLFGALEILLAFRLVLKILGAGASSGFVRGMHGITGLFILPFEGIFRRALNQGIETTSILEPATIVAIIVYAVAAVGIVKLIRIFSGERQA